MSVQHINFESLKAKGNIIAEERGGGFFLSATKSIRGYYLPTRPLSSCVTISKRFRLPLKINMTLNMPLPGLHLLLGEGHISFGTMADNRSLSDIAESDKKRPKHFNNRISLAEDNEITILYGLKFMQIIVNDETRYFSKKEKYMRSKLFADMNEAGFELSISTDKFAEATLKKMTVEEYDTEPDTVPINNEITSTNFNISKGVKASFEECISLLAPMLQEEIIKTDRFLMKQNELKIKRKIEGDHLGCKITYISNVHGFSYSLRIHENLMSHYFWWYMVANHKFDDKFMGRKNDLTDLTLKNIYELLPDIAERLVDYYAKCDGCKQTCSVKTVYELNNKKFLSCHGQMQMNMNLQTFSDFKFMIDLLKNLV